MSGTIEPVAIGGDGSRMNEVNAAALLLSVSIVDCANSAVAASREANIAKPALCIMLWATALLFALSLSAAAPLMLILRAPSSVLGRPSVPVFANAWYEN